MILFLIFQMGLVNDFITVEEYLIIKVLDYFFFLIGYCCFPQKHRYFTKIIDWKIYEIQGEISAHCSYIYTNKLRVPWTIPRLWDKLARRPASMLMNCQSPEELNSLETAYWDPWNGLIAKFVQESFGTVQLHWAKITP